jgi:Mg/Co/Ni transporter MgtE
MKSNIISVNDKIDQAEVGELFPCHAVDAIPVVEEFGRIRSIVTTDDIVWE